MVYNDMKMVSNDIKMNEMHTFMQQNGVLHDEMHHKMDSGGGDAAEPDSV